MSDTAFLALAKAVAVVSGRATPWAVFGAADVARVTMADWQRCFHVTEDAAPVYWAEISFSVNRLSYRAVDDGRLRDTIARFLRAITLAPGAEAEVRRLHQHALVSSGAGGMAPPPPPAAYASVPRAVDTSLRYVGGGAASSPPRSQVFVAAGSPPTANSYLRMSPPGPAAVPETTSYAAVTGSPSRYRSPPRPAMAVLQPSSAPRDGVLNSANRPVDLSSGSQHHQLRYASVGRRPGDLASPSRQWAHAGSSPAYAAAPHHHPLGGTPVSMMMMSTAGPGGVISERPTHPASDDDDVARAMAAGVLKLQSGEGRPAASAAPARPIDTPAPPTPIVAPHQATSVEFASLAPPPPPLPGQPFRPLSPAVPPGLDTPMRTAPAETAGAPPTPPPVEPAPPRNVVSRPAEAAKDVVVAATHLGQRPGEQHGVTAQVSALPGSRRERVKVRVDPTPR